MRKILCPMIFVCALIVGSVSADISEMDRWNFVHKKFIKEPEATLMGWVNRNYNGVGLSMMVIPSALIGATGLGVSVTALTKPNFFDEYVDNKMAQDWLNNKKYMAFCAGGSVALVAVTGLIHKGFMNWIKRSRANLNYEVFKNYIKHWDEYKEQTPVALHEVFEKGYGEYIHSRDPIKYLDEAARLVANDIIKIILGACR